MKSVSIRKLSKFALHLISALDPQAILRAPCKKNYSPNPTLRQKIAVHFGALTGKLVRDVEAQLPEKMPCWGKVRIRDGDSICCTWLDERHSENGRNMGFIRASFSVIAMDLILIVDSLRAKSRIHKIRVDGYRPFHTVDSTKSWFASCLLTANFGANLQQRCDCSQ